MIARLDAVAVGAAIGYLSARLGYGTETWLFWIFAMPAATWYGCKRGNKP